MDCSEVQMGHKRPQVSVIVPAYRSGDVLQRAVRSVLKQDYPNLQLIVCDDGTEAFDKDGLDAFIRREGAGISYHIIHQQENVGTVRNLNAGLECAQGEWILPLAADDLLADSTVISKLMRQAAERNLDWVIPRTELCDERMNRSGEIIPAEPVRTEITAGNMQGLLRRLCFECCLPSSGSLLRRQLLLNMGGFNSKFRLVEDWPLFLSLIRRGVCPQVSDEVAVLHRAGGVSGRQAARNRAYQQDLMLVMQTEIKPFLQNLDEQDRRKVLRQIGDKEAVFQWRFSCTTWKDRLTWGVMHAGTILRKLF